jgi:hypothetical protein
MELNDSKYMNEDRFWELVELAHWPCDYDKMKIKYLKLMSKEQCHSFRATLSAAYNLLDNAISKNKEINDDLGVGDDSYSDLLHHIIGLGKDEFYKHLKDLKLVKSRANKYAYEESFAYCIPYDDDYKEDGRYSLAAVEKIVRDSLKEISMYLKMDNGKVQWLVPIRNEMLEIEELMQEFLKNPTAKNLDILVEAEKWVDKSCKKIDKFFKDNYDELPRKFTDPRPNGCSFNGMCTALFGNTVEDAKLVKEFLK